MARVAVVSADSGCKVRLTKARELAKVCAAAACVIALQQLKTDEDRLNVVAFISKILIEHPSYLRRTALDDAYKED